MTLIAFHAQQDRADIVTDSWSYTPTGRHLGRCTKVAVLPDIDAAVTGQGMTAFTDGVRQFAQDLQAPHVDRLNKALARVLPKFWASLEDRHADLNAETGGQVEPRESVAFTIGYSPRAGRFVATAFGSGPVDHDGARFVPQEITGPFVLPSPAQLRPSTYELDKLRASLAHLGGADRLLDLWASRPELQAPASTDDWITLAELCRAERSMIAAATGIKVLMGGDLVHTSLKRGESGQERIYVFDDSPETLRQVLAGTLHPLGQAGPCECGSDVPGVECCLPAAATVPCPCSSGKTFGDCCSTASPAAPVDVLVP